LGYFTFWKELLHKWLKKMRNEFGLKWLRFSMSYHRFPNLREMLTGDLASKLTKGVESMDFMMQKCNCIDPRGNGQYQYGDMCKIPIIVVKITCKMTNKIYIRNTQQNFKKRMKGHFHDVKKLMEKGVHSDSYARHFNVIWPRGAASPCHRG
jgi:hypothetical protein